LAATIAGRNGRALRWQQRGDVGEVVVQIVLCLVGRLSFATTVGDIGNVVGEIAQPSKSCAAYKMDRLG
jgi:hypothetical protein